ncbi:hypothetical protein I4U23_020364 [Adineta vaga]|nr:hypothetical protein I4U23_020364 [Adineta vaga]
MDFQNDQFNLILDHECFSQLHALKIKDEILQKLSKNESELDCEQLLFRKVFNDENKLEVFEYMPQVSSLRWRRFYGLKCNVHIRSLTIHLHDFQDLFTFFEYTPNLRYLKLESLSPYLSDTYQYDNVFGIELNEFHMKFNPAQTGPLGTCYIGVDFDRIIRAILRFSSSLISLSLNFVDMNWIRDRDDFPFNGIKLENQLLSQLINLENFHFYSRKVFKDNNIHRILSTFKTQFWFDRNWTVGAHYYNGGVYIYSLPFHFHEFRSFTNFNPILYNNDDVLTNTHNLWSNITTLEFFIIDGLYFKELFRLIKINMPKLKVIKFLRDFSDQSISPIEIKDIDIVLNTVTTVSLHQVFLEDLKQCFINALPNVKHLILISSTLPAGGNELTDMLSRRIQRLNINSYYEIQNLAELDKSYLTNLKELQLIFGVGGFTKEKNSRSKLIMNLLRNFPSLKILSIYALPCSGCTFYSADQIFQPVIDYLDPDEMKNKYEIKRCGQYLRFVKI